MDQWEMIAERKIREAMEEGAFENLRGKGRPLDLEENPYEDPSLRMESGHSLNREMALTQNGDIRQIEPFRGRPAACPFQQDWLAETGSLS